MTQLKSLGSIAANWRSDYIYRYMVLVGTAINIYILLYIYNRIYIYIYIIEHRIIYIDISIYFIDRINTAVNIDIYWINIGSGGRCMGCVILVFTISRQRSPILDDVMMVIIIIIITAIRHTVGASRHHRGSAQPS